MYQTIQRRDIATVFDRLRAEHSYKQDMVIPARDLHFSNYRQGMPTATPFMFVAPSEVNKQTYQGFSNGFMTSKAEQNLAAKLKMPMTYFEYLKQTYPRLLVDNLNYLSGHSDQRLLLRTFKPDSPFIGLADGEQTCHRVRSVLSDRYKRIDNLDVLGAVTRAIAETGVDVEVGQASLTENHMFIDFVARNPQSFPDFLADYQAPGSGNGGQTGVVTGFSVRNSETGASRFQIVPRAIVLACNNGLVVTRDAIARTHLGSRISESGVIWSHDTMEKELDLIIAQTRDAVTRFLSPEYLGQTIADIMACREHLEHPSSAAMGLGQRLRFDQEQTGRLIEVFLGGGDKTTTGLLHVATYMAQQMDVERQYEVEADAMALLPGMKQLDKPWTNN